MKRCLNCRMTYSDELLECPHCGYKPRSKGITKKLDTTQEFDPVVDTKTYKKKNNTKNIKATSNHSGSFYLKSGERLNKRYSVMSVMGFGAFGVAYECFDSFNQKNVVVKEYMPSYLVTRSSNGREVESLSEEAEVNFQIGADAFIDESNKLNDNDVECVPKLVESFKQNNTSYIVTELVRGEALSSIIKRKGKLTYHATITIITGVLQGLRKLNKVGIIHGDICPDNIIVTSDSDVYLLDYNLSDFNKNVYTQRDSGKLRAGYSALEMYYMNMEQGPWTDVYAAAATMYKMLTGMTVPSAIKRNTSDSLTSLSKLGVPITQGAEKAMFKALKVDYEKRTQNPEDFLNGLMGDGFDNISVEKVNNPRRHTSKPPSRPKQYSPHTSSNTANKVLNGILTFLILTIVALVIWLFISGVFTLPGSIKDSLGTLSRDDTVSTNLPSDDEENEDDDESSSGAFFFKDEDSQPEDEEDSSEDENPYELPDISSWADQVESAIDNYFSSQEENNESYDYDYDNNNDDWYGDYQSEYNSYNENESIYENNESSSESSQSLTDTIIEFTSRYFQQ